MRIRETILEPIGLPHERFQRLDIPYLGITPLGFLQKLDMVRTGGTAPSSHVQSQEDLLIY